MGFNKGRRGKNLMNSFLISLSPIKNIVITGMGGSALAGLIVKKWLENEITLPIEIIRNYNLPKSVSKNTLVIASSYSGNTEESISALTQAIEIGAQVATVSSHGKMEEIARKNQIAHVKLPTGLQPRMAVIYNFRALTKILVNFGIISNEKHEEIEHYADFLRKESESWAASVSNERNYA